jgi:hypothetical protein
MEERQGMEEPARAAVLRLALTSLAIAHILGDIDVLLAHPEGKASHQRPRLGAAEMASKWPVMALAEHLSP